MTDPSYLENEIHTKEDAIFFIKEARRVHVEWAEFIRENPGWHSGEYSPGDEAHHLKWVRQYDTVLKFLAD